MKAAVGLRVVRGPDWELSDQRGDGGEGFVGTMVEVGGTKGSKLAENKVWVQWDSGMRRDHRAGQYGKYYDLCVFDSSPAGVVHSNCTCDGCSKSPILGMRWRCLECHDYNLCTGCYMADEHNKHHKFERIDSSDSEGVPVCKRFGATKIQAKGVFAGARVVRGFNWSGDNQDGGKEKEGVVLEVTEHEGVPHSGAVVSWDCGGKNNYRLGYQGKVDIKCVTPGTGGHYYKDHLQRLGEVPQRKKGITKTGKVETSEDETLQGTRKLQVGDNARVTLPVDVVKLLNDTDGCAGWNDDTKPYLGKLGKVERVGKTVEIKYDDGAILGFHAGAVKKDEVLETAHGRKRAMPLDDSEKKNKAEAKSETKSQAKPESVKSETKPEARPESKPGATGTDSTNNGDISLKPGLLVKVMNDEEIVKNIQESCGLMWNMEIAECVGKVGEIKSVRSNGVVELSMNGTSDTPTVLFNKVLLTTETAPVDPEEEEGAGGISIEEFKSFLQSGVSLWDLFGTEVRLRGASLGDLFGPEVQWSDDQVGELLGTDLFLESVANTAISNESSADRENSEEGGMLGTSASRGLLQRVKEVLQRNPHLIDKKHSGLTPLHKASSRGHVEVIKYLLENNASITLKDHQDATVLHHAAYGDYSGAAVRVLAKYGADLNENANNDGSTPLDIAVKYGNEAAVRALIQLGCDVNVQNFKGCVALHAAVDQNLENLTEILLTAKGINLRHCDVRGINPFLLAVIRGYLSIVKAMVKRSKKIVNVPEENHGMTALHFAALYDDVEITKLLLQSEFCDPDARNSSGLTSAELATAAGNVKIVELFRNPGVWSVTQEEKGPREGEQQSPLSANNNSGASKRQRLQVHEFQFGDMCRIKRNKPVVEAFQIAHAGWNTSLDKFLGAEGMVLAKLSTGDLRFQSAGMPRDIILNPASLEPSIPDEPRQIYVPPETNRNEETGLLSRNRMWQEYSCTRINRDIDDTHHQN